ncbi:MAG: hypothetical protein DWQ35_00440 [Planctomycetota bacterium]|nr:MAG: hypothetical protein DWQ35_00440 [Planctomycetota bacterium]
MKNERPPTERELARAVRVLFRGYLDSPDECDGLDLQTVRMTPAAWSYARSILDRLKQPVTEES